MERILGVSKLFFKRDTMSSEILMLEKIKDDLFLAGSVEKMEIFVGRTRERFSVSKALVNQK